MTKARSKFLSIILLTTLSILFSACSDQKSDESSDNTSNESQKAQSAEQVQSWAGDVYEREYSPSMGPADAKVTIVEFLDPACSACRAFYPFVKEILKRHPDDVRLVIRYAAFHQGSEEIIRLLEIAKQQNIYLTILEALLNLQEEWVINHKPDLDKAWEIAEKAGMDTGSAKVQIYSERINRMIKQETDDLRSLQVGQTPTFFVNKQALAEFGAKPLYDLVTKEIAK